MRAWPWNSHAAARSSPDRLAPPVQRQTQQATLAPPPPGRQRSLRRDSAKSASTGASRTASFRCLTPGRDENGGYYGRVATEARVADTA
ncbi:hypothetical protein GCM10010245_60090 [Streptomyces spectabilis]|nr:hypothetical protein GCM10010245_60090 [Streptomyces spectabilis]